MNEVIKQAADRIRGEFPEWSDYINETDGDLEVAIPAPNGSNAGHLIVFNNGNDLWVRFAPPRLCYLVDDVNELVSLLKQLVSDEVVFKLTKKGDEWLETTLVRPTESGQISSAGVSYISWSGKRDK